jgi:hypothetical protein
VSRTIYEGDLVMVHRDETDDDDQPANRRMLGSRTIDEEDLVTVHRDENDDGDQPANRPRPGSRLIDGKGLVAAHRNEPVPLNRFPLLVAATSQRAVYSRQSMDGEFLLVISTVVKVRWKLSQPSPRYTRHLTKRTRQNV